MRKALLSVLAVAGCATSLSAQTVTLKLIQTEDLFPLIVSRNPQTQQLIENPFWIGQLPTAVEAKPDGSAVFIGGAFNDGADRPLNSTWKSAVTKIEYDSLGNRVFRAMPLTRLNPSCCALGVQSLDYSAGQTLIPAVTGVPASVRPVGLLVTTDLNATANDQTQWYDVDTQLNPVLIRRTEQNLGFDVVDRWGNAGQSWDWGHSGIPTGGYSYTTADGQSATNSPLVASMVFGDHGPRGAFKETLRPDFDTQYSVEFGQPNSPRIRPQGSGQRLWRDIDISDKNGILVARADNFIDIVARNSMNEVDFGNTRRLSSPEGQGSFVSLQNAKILNDTPAGDLAIWNSRNSFSITNYAFLDSIQITKLTAPPLNQGGSLPALTVNVVDSNNQPLTMPAAIGAYDFVWVPGLQQLIVLEISGAARMYRFQIIDGVPVSCFVDFNADGFLNQEDLGGYLTAFLDENVPPGPSGTSTAPCPGAPAPYDTLGYAADFNRDCNFDQEDLGGFITEFFSQSENPTTCIPG